MISPWVLTDIMGVYDDDDDEDDDDGCDDDYDGAADDGFDVMDWVVSL